MQLMKPLSSKAGGLDDNACFLEDQHQRQSVRALPKVKVMTIYYRYKSHMLTLSVVICYCKSTFCKSRTRT